MADAAVRAHGRHRPARHRLGRQQGRGDPGAGPARLAGRHGRQRARQLAGRARGRAADARPGRGRQGRARLLHPRAPRPPGRLLGLLPVQGGGRRADADAGLRVGPPRDHRQRDRPDRVPLRADGVDVRRRGPRPRRPRGDAVARSRSAAWASPTTSSARCCSCSPPPRTSSPARWSTSTAGIRRAEPWSPRGCASRSSAPASWATASPRCSRSTARRSSSRTPSARRCASVPERIAANLRALGEDPAVAASVALEEDLEAALDGADFVFEAAPEDLELKQELFARLDRAAPPAAILASNTSVMRIGDIAARANHGERIVGTHWWNPPYLVPLVEVVQADRTPQGTVARTIELLRERGQDARARAPRRARLHRQPPPARPLAPGLRARRRRACATPRTSTR